MVRIGVTGAGVLAAGILPVVKARGSCRNSSITSFKITFN